MDSIEIIKRMKNGDERMGRIEESQKKLQEKLDKNTDTTKEVLDILNKAKSFFRFAEITGNFVKWAAGVLVPVISIWYAVKGGGQK